MRLERFHRLFVGAAGALIVGLLFWLFAVPSSVGGWPLRLLVFGAGALLALYVAVHRVDSGEAR